MRSGEDQYTNNEASVPRRSRAQSDAVWRRRRELDPNFSLSVSLLFSVSLRLTLLSANVTPEDHSVHTSLRSSRSKERSYRRNWTKRKGARERNKDKGRGKWRSVRARERQREGKGASSGAVRERTFVIAPRVTRCPRSVATPPDARQSSVRRATVVSYTDRFS